MRAQEKFWLYVILGSELGTLGSPRSAAGEEVRYRNKNEILKIITKINICASTYASRS